MHTHKLSFILALLIISLSACTVSQKADQNNKQKTNVNVPVNQYNKNQVEFLNIMIQELEQKIQTLKNKSLPNRTKQIQNKDEIKVNEDVLKLLNKIKDDAQNQ